MFGISGEHLLILGIVLLIFGPRRLPELGNTLGRAIRNFKDAISGVEEAKFRKIAEDESKLQVKQMAEAQSQPSQKVEQTTPLSSSVSPAPIAPLKDAAPGTISAAPPS